jgi:hypothetical protein
MKNELALCSLALNPQAPTDSEYGKAGRRISEHCAERRCALHEVAPTPGDRFQLMFEANRIGRPLTQEEVEEFMKKKS